jgi:hypothetical protein
LQIEVVVKLIGEVAKRGQSLRESGRCALASGDSVVPDLMWLVIAWFEVVGNDLQEVRPRAGVDLRDCDTGTKGPWGSIVVVVEARVYKNLCWLAHRRQFD